MFWLAHKTENKTTNRFENELGMFAYIFIQYNCHIL